MHLLNWQISTLFSCLTVCRLDSTTLTMAELLISIHIMDYVTKSTQYGVKKSFILYLYDVTTIGLFLLFHVISESYLLNCNVTTY